MRELPEKTRAARLLTEVRTPLLCFVATGLLMAVLSLPHSSNPAPPQSSPSSSPAAVKPLTTSSPVPSSVENTPLANAVKAEDTAAVRALLESGADPNGVLWEEYSDCQGAKQRYSDGLLWVAASKGNLEIAKLLLRHGAEVNPKGDSSTLSVAAQEGHLKVVKLLLRYGAEVNPKGQQSPLAWASYSADGLPIMKLLIRHGADVNAHFDRGATVMTVARFHYGEEAVALLKKHGAHR